MNFVEQALSNLCATRQKGPKTFNRSNEYRAQWTYYTPAGYRDEPFDVPFSFTVPEDGNPHQNFPIQLDDDAPYIIRGFFQNGSHSGGTPAALLGIGFAQIWDAQSPPNGVINAVPNPTQPAVLGYNFGGWGFGPFSWPVEQELYCQPGSLLMLDFQLVNNATSVTIHGSLLGVKRRKEC